MKRSDKMPICYNAGTSSATLQAIRKTELPHGTIFEDICRIAHRAARLSNISRGCRKLTSACVRAGTEDRDLPPMRSC